MLVFVLKEGALLGVVRRELAESEFSAGKYRVYCASKFDKSTKLINTEWSSLNSGTTHSPIQVNEEKYKYNSS